MPERCQHCQKAPATKPRRLCWWCYYKAGVRDLYPTLPHRNGYRALPDFNGDYPPAAVPTSAAPGSEAKIRVLERRAAARQQLFHPLDGPTEAGPC